MNYRNNYFINLLISIILLSITACGGSGTETIVELDPPASVGCVSNDDGSINEGCGALILGLTDGDGDFLTYNVEISGVELTRADGTQISVMPTSQRVDFVNYIELSELAAAAIIPVGNYTSGSITINYTNADIQVELNSSAANAIMIDEFGQPLLSQTLELQLDVDNQLEINRSHPALLELDFNLAASHTVNLEVNPVLRKEFRVRGPLIEVNEADLYFRIHVRSFHRKDGRFGNVNMHVAEETNFEIDGEAYSGSAGLTQMAGLSADTPTVSL